MNVIRIGSPEDRPKREWPTVPTGEYQARVVNIEEIANTFKKKDTDPETQLKATLGILGGPHAGVSLVYYMSTNFSTYTDKETKALKKTKSLMFLEAVMGEELMPGQEIVLTDLIDLPCTITVVREPNGTDPEGNKLYKNKIVALEPAQVVTLQRAQAPAYDPEPEPVAQPSTGVDTSDLDTRWMKARNALNLTAAEIQEAIEFACGKETKFFNRLSAGDKKLVVLHVEKMMAQQDIPFNAPDEADRELDEAGLISPTTKR